MNKQRKVLITITYNEMGIIIDTKAEEVAQPEVETQMSLADCISRRGAIDALRKDIMGGLNYESIIKDLPSAQPEPKEIGYTECANAMLKMWIDNVLTDGEYNRIMDKLNKHWGKKEGDADD